MVEIFDTGRKTNRLIHTMVYAIYCALRFATSREKHTVVFHGAYSPAFWLATLLRNVRTYSIVQGSELNTDYHGWRAWVVRTILRRSRIVACRNQVQCDEVVRLCRVPPERCQVVHWGLNPELFTIERPPREAEIVVISPRATQREYNIPAILEAVDRLKSDGHPIRLVYVRFNASFEVDPSNRADERLDEPSQSELWQAIARADICVSVPNYDGLSNTVLETLALGSFPVCTDLPPYGFLKDDARLGALVPLGGDPLVGADCVSRVIEDTIERLDDVRQGATFRRNYALENFGTCSGIKELCEAIGG